MTFKKYNTKSHSEAVVYFFTQLDLDMINNLLDDNKLYLENSKSDLIVNLFLLFEKFSKNGDTSLLKYQGFCDNADCDQKCIGFSFVGNRSQSFIDLLIEEDADGNFEDFTECNNFKNNDKKFQLQKNQLEKLFIDPHGDIPF